MIGIPGHPWWHHAVAHAALQGVYLAAFRAAQRFQRQYRQLAAEVDAHQREGARRRALLAEARGEYARALALGKDGVFSGQAVGGYALGRFANAAELGAVFAAALAGGLDPAWRARGWALLERAPWHR